MFGPEVVSQWIAIAVAYLLLFGWLPGMLYPGRRLDSDGRLSLLLITMFGIIAAVHGLVVLGIFHALSFVAVSVVLIAVCRWMGRPPVPVRTWLREELNALYSNLEGGVGDRWYIRLVQSRSAFSASRIATAVLTAAVLGIALYLRLAWPLNNTLPTHPDVFTHASWLAQLQDQVLFPNGAYPFGMHTLMAPVLVLTGLSPTEYLRWAGPFHNWLAVITVYVFVLRVTGQRLAAVVGALLLGTLPDLVGGSFYRQAAGLPQEFSFVLILPAVWLAYRYLSDGHRLFLFGAVTAAGIAAATHPITTLFVAVSLGTTSLMLWLSGITRFSRVLALGTSSALLITVGVAPVLAAPVFGVPLYESGVTFLFSEATLRPALTPSIWLGAVLSALALPALFWRAIPPPQRVALGLLAGSIGLYLLPYTGLAMAPLSHRAADYLTIPLAVGGGLIWAWLITGLRRIGAPDLAAVALTTLLIAASWWLYPPSPATLFVSGTDDTQSAPRTVFSNTDGAVRAKVFRTPKI